jgi:large subunit ribosomal protein L10
MQVVKASIARVHLREAGFEGDIDGVFKGPVALVTSSDPEGAVGVARSMVHLVKEHKKVKLQGAIYDGSVMGGNGVEDLSRMPTRDQLLSRLAGAVQAPTRGLANSLYQMSSKVASAFDALRRKREGEEG